MFQLSENVCIALYGSSLCRCFTNFSYVWHMYMVLQPRVPRFPPTPLPATSQAPQ
jgi:hypothetical protein